MGSSFQKNLPIIAVIDTFVAVVIIPQILAFYWNGTWLLLEIYVFPEDFEKSAWVCYIVGNSMFIFATLVQDILRRSFVPEDCRQSLKLFLIYKVYIYILGFSAITQWRGIAYVAMLYTGMSLTSALIGLSTAAVLLCLLRNYLGTIFPPLTFGLDPDVASYFKIQTRFSTEPGCNFRFLFDTLFTVFIVNTLVIFVLKGQWIVLELLMPLESENPAEYLLTGMTSLLIFYGLIVLPVVGQYELQKVSRNLKRRWKIVLQEIFLFLFGLLPMLFWRGIYYLHLSFLTTEYYETYAWTAHALGFIAINVTLTSGSMVPIGCVCDTDAFEFENGVFDYRYVKTFVDKKIEKKKTKIKHDIEYSTASEKLYMGKGKEESISNNHENTKLFENHSSDAT